MVSKPKFLSSEMVDEAHFAELCQRVTAMADNREENKRKIEALAKKVDELKEAVAGLLNRFPVPTTPTRARQSGDSSNPSGKAMIEPEPPDLVGSGNLKTGGVMIVDEPSVHDEISTTKLVAMKETSDLDACQLFDELPKSASINDNDRIEQEGLERVESMVAKKISVPDQHAIKCSLIFLISKLVKKNALSNSPSRFAEVLESNDVLKQDVRAHRETIDESNDEEEAADLVAHQVFDEMSKPLFSYETESLQEAADLVAHQVFDEMSKRLFSYETESLLQTAEEVHGLKVSAINFLNNATLLLLVKSDFTHKLMLPCEFCDSIDYLKTVCFDPGGEESASLNLKVILLPKNSNLCLIIEELQVILLRDITFAFVVHQSTLLASECELASTHFVKDSCLAMLIFDPGGGWHTSCDFVLCTDAPSRSEIDEFMLKSEAKNSPMSFRLTRMQKVELYIPLELFKVDISMVMSSEKWRYVLNMCLMTNACVGMPPLKLDFLNEVSYLLLLLWENIVPLLNANDSVKILIFDPSGDKFLSSDHTRCLSNESELCHSFLSRLRKVSEYLRNIVDIELQLVLALAFNIHLVDALIMFMPKFAMIDMLYKWLDFLEIAWSEASIVGLSTELIRMMTLLVLEIQSTNVVVAVKIVQVKPFYHESDAQCKKVVANIKLPQNARRVLSCSTSYDAALAPCAIILAHLIAAGFAQFITTLATIFRHKTEILLDDQPPKFMEQTTDYFQGVMTVLSAISGRLQGVLNFMEYHHLTVAEFAQFATALTTIPVHKAEMLQGVLNFMEHTKGYFIGDMKLLCVIDERFGANSTSLNAILFKMIGLLKTSTTILIFDPSGKGSRIHHIAPHARSLKKLSSDFIAAYYSPSTVISNAVCGHVWIVHIAKFVAGLLGLKRGSTRILVFDPGGDCSMSSGAYFCSAATVACSQLLLYYLSCYVLVPRALLMILEDKDPLKKGVLMQDYSLLNILSKPGSFNYFILPGLSRFGVFVCT